MLRITPSATTKVFLQSADIGGSSGSVILPSAAGGIIEVARRAVGPAGAKGDQGLRGLPGLDGSDAFFGFDTVAITGVTTRPDIAADWHKQFILTSSASALTLTIPNSAEFAAVDERMLLVVNQTDADRTLSLATTTGTAVTFGGAMDGGTSMMLAPRASVLLSASASTVLMVAKLGAAEGLSGGGIHQVYLSNTFNKVRIGIEDETFTDVATTRFIAAEEANGGEIVLNDTLSGGFRVIFSYNSGSVADLNGKQFIITNNTNQPISQWAIASGTGTGGTLSNAGALDHFQQGADWH